MLRTHRTMFNMGRPAFILSLIFLVSFLSIPSLVLSKTRGFPLTPNERHTSGSLCHEDDDDWYEYRYSQGVPICRRNVSLKLRNQVYDLYGVSLKCRGDYTIDHFIPLSLGGSNALNNLWPENKAIKATRRDLELELYHQIRTGQITQGEAIRRIKREKMRPSAPMPDPNELCR